jgi:argininosuccinate synthase
MTKKIILAFSGGLDTSFCIPYLQEKGFEVITAAVNTGGFSPAELVEISDRSKELKALNHYEIDAQQKLYDDFGSYIIKANYLKGGVYPACVGPERNVIAEEIAKIAKQENTTFIAHGSTGAGNDQVRFDLAFKALIPNCQIITPIREGGFTREEEAEILAKKGVNISPEIKAYSINVGLLGTTIGGKETYDSLEELPDEIFPTVKPLDKTPNEATEFTLDFKAGLPIALNGKKINGVEIIKTLNSLGAEHGFGKDYHLGTTIIGIKARIGFEAPALQILIKAHGELEKLTLTSKQIFWKNHLGNVYGDLVHEALACDPLVKDLEAFFDSASKVVNGQIKLKLFRGKCTISSIQSSQTLLGKNGVYGETTGQWTGQDAQGFCQIYGLESVNASHNLQA